MNLSRVRAFSLLAFFLGAFFACAPGAFAQERAPNFWFQGTRLIFDRATPMQGDLAISTRDSGLRRFLDRLGANVAYQPGQRYVVVTAQDRRTIVFTLGDPAYTVAGVRAQAPFAPFADGNDVVLHSTRWRARSTSSRFRRRTRRCCSRASARSTCAPTDRAPSSRCAARCRS
jgi:hypothetical protein